MPLFFLISGFFANMVLRKYGVWLYLRRRIWRIGMPLLVAIFIFSGLRIAQSEYAWLQPDWSALFGAPAMGFGTVAQFMVDQHDGGDGRRDRCGAGVV